MPDMSEKVPAGIAIIASIQGFSALFLIVHVIIAIPFVIVTFFEDPTLGLLKTFGMFWNWIMVAIHGTITVALFSRKNWSRNFIIIVSIIGLIFAIINILAGNLFSIVSIIIHSIVIGYMNKPHIKKWFNEDSVKY